MFMKVRGEDGLQARLGLPALTLGSAFHSVDGSQSGLPGPGPLASPGRSLEMRILGPSPELLTHGLRGLA